MKKFMVLTMCALSIVTLSGCGQDATEQNEVQIEETNFNEEALLTLAKEQANDLIDGNAGNLISTFNEDMLATGLNAETLNTTIENFTANMGDYVDLYSETGTIKDGLYIVEIIQEYTNGGVKIMLVYDTNNDLAGLNINHAHIEKPLVSTDKFEEVEVKIGETMPLDGILTLPKGIENPPVVLLIHGSGPADKNSTISVNTPFLDIAHGLAEQGVASLRYNKRTYSYPKEMVALGVDLTLRDEVLNDVDLAINLLSANKQNRTNPKAIFVLGHSMSGGLTPVIATEHNNIAGIIAMASTLDPMFEVSYAQNKDVEKAVNESDMDEVTKKMITEQMAAVEKDINILRGDISDIPNDQILLGLPAGYQKSIKELAGINFIDHVEVPILVLQGTADFQVKADKDFASWQDALTDNPDAEFKLYDNLNHLMMPSNGSQDISEYQIKSEVSEEVINDIADFVQTVTNNLQ
ncbi:MAG: hypothetical protein ATN31_05050 [Candidatus Epulonipiscioides saccharophilum]|nr:MAG: hypothetical protein ATN31_05050 [Epulopiscium sp. AS2M-Bin001]